MDIKVTGEYTLDVPADEGVVRVSLRFSGRDKAAVMNETVGLTNAARAEFESLQSAGAVTSFAIESVRTWAYYPDKRSRERREHEHHAIASAHLTFVDFDELGRIVAEIGTRPGWTLDGVTWQLARATRFSVEPLVLREAFGKAQERAGWLADAADAHNLRVVEIADEASERIARPMAMYARAAAASGAEASVELAPDPIEVVGRVTVVFRADG
jgi:uncharacterized protein YggE